MNLFAAEQNIVNDGYDTSTRPLYELSDHLGEQLPPAIVAHLQDEAAVYVALGVDRPRVSLRRWHDEYPLPAEVEAFIAAGRRASADLAAAVEASRIARGAS